MATRSNEAPSRRNRSRIVSWILALSYMVGAPLVACLEYSGRVFSQRFDYASEFIYVICIVQFLCSVGLLLPRLASWAAALLTVIAVGAVASHLKIGSPLTALPAVAYAVAQVWFIRENNARAAGPGNTA